MIDSHLVMNVLNIMAARDFKENGRESPLLFALSDYLQVAFLQQTETSLLLVDELASLKSRVALLAEVQAGHIEVVLHNRGQADWRVVPGALSSVATGLLGLARGSQTRSARLVLTIDGQADAAGRVQVTADLLERGDGAAYDMTVAARRLAALLDEETSNLPLPSPPRWSQSSPAQLTVNYSLRVTP